MNCPTLVLILGPSGVGKSSLIKTLCQQNPQKYRKIKPYTTRNLRDNEKGKISVTKSTFLDLVKKNEIIFPNKVYNHLYGPSKREITKLLSQKFIPLLDWPVNKILQFTMALPNINLITIYIKPPNLTILKKRLKKDERDITGQRYELAVHELQQIKKGIYSQHITDYITNNEGTLEKNAHAIHQLIKKHLNN